MDQIWPLLFSNLPLIFKGIIQIKREDPVPMEPIEKTSNLFNNCINIMVLRYRRSHFPVWLQNVRVHYCYCWSLSLWCFADMYYQSYERYGKITKRRERQCRILKQSVLWWSLKFMGLADFRCTVSHVGRDLYVDVLQNGSVFSMVKSLWSFSK